MVGEDGAALIEFTLFAPLLVVASIYTMDFGLLFYNKMEVQNAAQAGADWAIANRVYNPALIQDAAQNATKIPAVDITVISNEFCGCPSATGVELTDGTSPPDPCKSATPTICSGGATCGVGGPLAGNYVTVCTIPKKAYQSVAFGLFSVAPKVKAFTMARIQ
jgi:Flp pilus assembly protein TadG